MNNGLKYETFFAVYPNTFPYGQTMLFFQESKGYIVYSPMVYGMQHDDLPKREIESRNSYHMIHVSLKNFGIISKLDIVLLQCNSNTMQIAIFPCFLFQTPIDLV